MAAQQKVTRGPAFTVCVFHSVTWTGSVTRSPRETPLKARLKQKAAVQEQVVNISCL